MPPPADPKIHKRSRRRTKKEVDEGLTASGSGNAHDERTTSIRCLCVKRSLVLECDLDLNDRVLRDLITVLLTRATQSVIEGLSLVSDAEVIDSVHLLHRFFKACLSGFACLGRPVSLLG